jgi:hypothetical protein
VRAPLAILFGTIGAALVVGCLGDIEDYDCEYRGFCADPAAAAQAVCTPGQVEETACGVCGVMSHSCGEDGHWGPMSACVDPRPGCNPCAEPTWDEPIDGIMERRCNHCHGESRTYSGILTWVDDGSLEDYTLRNHFINGADKTAVLRWIEIGVPRSACDVPAP